MPRTIDAPSTPSIAPGVSAPVCAYSIGAATRYHPATRPPSPSPYTAASSPRPRSSRPCSRLRVAPGDAEQAVQQRGIRGHRDGWREDAELAPLVGVWADLVPHPLHQRLRQVGVDADHPGEVVCPQPAEAGRSEEHTSELQSQSNLVCRLLLEKKT